MEYIATLPEVNIEWEHIKPPWATYPAKPPRVVPRQHRSD